MMHDQELMTRELAAMAEVGRRRLRTRTILFAICLVAIGGLMIATFGVIIAVVGAAPLAGLLAFALAKGLDDKIISDVAEAHSVPREALAGDKYLIR
jgi:hypothetical protein